MADVSGILAAGNYEKPANPLETLSKLQGLKVQQQQLTNMKTQNDTQQQALSTARVNRVNQVSLGLLGSTNDPEDMERRMRASIDAEVQSGTISPQVAAVWNSQVPPAIGADGSKTPVETYNNILRQHITANLSPQEAVNYVRPQGGWIDVGGQKVFATPPAQVTPTGSQPSLQGAMNNTLAPQTTTITRPDGSGTERTIGGGYGVPPPVVPTEGGNTAPTAPPNGANVVPYVNPPNGPPGRGGVPNNPPLQAGYVQGPDGKYYVTQKADSGGFVTRPGHVLGSTPEQLATAQPQQAPVTQTAQADPWAKSLPTGAANTIEANQSAYRTASTNAASLPLANTQLMEAHDAIARLHANAALPSTGVFQYSLNKARQILSDLGMGDQAQNVKDAASAEKLLAAAIANKAPGSDARQALLEKANPSLNMPAGASLPIIRQIVGGNRAQQLIVDTAPDKTGNGFLDYQKGAKAKTYNSKEGLTALSWDMMTPSQQSEAKAEIAKSGPAAIKRFKEAVTDAHNNGMLTGNTTAPEAAPVPAPAPAPMAPNPLVAPTRNPLLNPRGA